MKSYFPFSILVLMALSLTGGCQKEADISDGPLITGEGILKRVLLYPSAEAKEPIAITEEYEYDDLGRIKQVSSPLYREGEFTGIAWYEEYIYDATDRLEEKKNFNANSGSPSGFLNLVNYTYTYNSSGQKEKERIEYPKTGNQEYNSYIYEDSRLIRSERYGNDNSLESYIMYVYDCFDKPVRESTFDESNRLLNITRHTYSGGLLTRTDIYALVNQRKIPLREIIRHYDEQNNLAILESHELSPFSSMAGYVLKYEYYGD